MVNIRDGYNVFFFLLFEELHILLINVEYLCIINKSYILYTRNKGSVE